jgi:(p)ppGpp synthase/HD superfamily hydrolase
MTPSRRYDEALAWASELHRNQKRKGTKIPYVSHLLAVSSLALEAGASEDEAIAALLHDAVEDQGGAPTLALVRERFGDVVAAIVAGCTDTDQDPKPPWRERKEAYLAHLPEAPASVRLVSLCDKLHNARSILADLRTHGPSVWDRFTGGKDGSLWYYRSLVEAYRRAGMSGPQLDELARTVDEMTRAAG